MNTQVNYRALQKSSAAQRIVSAIKTRAFSRRAAILCGVVICLGIAAIVYAATGDGDAAELLFTLAGIVTILSFLYRTPNRMKQFAKDNGFTFKTGADPRTPEEGIMGNSGSFNAATDDFNRTATQTMWQISGNYAGMQFAIGSLCIYRRYPMGNSGPFKERYAGVVKINTKTALPTLFCRSKKLEAGMTVFDSSLMHKQPDWAFAPLGNLADAQYSIYAPEGDASPDTALRQQIAPFLKALAKTMKCDVELNDTFIMLYIPNGIDASPAGMQKLFSVVPLVRACFSS